MKIALILLAFALVLIPVIAVAAGSANQQLALLPFVAVALLILSENL